ncbi:hypothetical protein GW17_00048470, partial [Ensete ventricosum]
FRSNTLKKKITKEILRANLNLIDEWRAATHKCSLKYKKVVAKLYNRRVYLRRVRMGDLVLRKTKVNNPTRIRGKLAPNWEGIYRVIDIVQDGTYHLATLDGDNYR